jgi:hypothetical protein
MKDITYLFSPINNFKFDKINCSLSIVTTLRLSLTKIPPQLVPKRNGKTETVWLAVRYDESQPCWNITRGSTFPTANFDLIFFSFCFHFDFILLSHS